MHTKCVLLSSLISYTDHLLCYLKIVIHSDCARLILHHPPLPHIPRINGEMAADSPALHLKYLYSRLEKLVANTTFKGTSNETKISSRFEQKGVSIMLAQFSSNSHCFFLAHPLRKLYNSLKKKNLNEKSIDGAFKWPHISAKGISALKTWRLLLCLGVNGFIHSLFCSITHFNLVTFSLYTHTTHTLHPLYHHIHPHLPQSSTIMWQTSFQSRQWLIWHWAMRTRDHQSPTHHRVPSHLPIGTCILLEWSIICYTSIDRIYVGSSPIEGGIRTHAPLSASLPVYVSHSHVAAGRMPVPMQNKGPTLVVDG